MSRTLTKPDPGVQAVRGRLAALPQTMTTDRVTITKGVAQELLLLNVHNRNLQLPKRDKYAAEMRRGRWRTIGDTIRVSKTGVLLNGQHTLAAIIDADGSYEYDVVWGLDDTAQDFMDTGSKRSLAHALGLKGEVNPTLLGGTVRMVWQIEQGGTPSSPQTECTYEEYYEFIVAHPEIRDSVKIANKAVKNLKLPASPLATAHYFCAQIDPNEADNFYVDLGDLSAVIADDSAVAAMRRTAQSWLRRGSLARVEQASLYDCLIRAFEAHRAGTKMPGSFRLTRRPKQFRTPQP